MDIKKNFIENNDIIFTPEEHIYKSKTKPEIEFTSVTQFVKKFFSEFDTQKISKKLTSSHPLYQHMTQEELLAKWESARDHGTKVHNEIESYLIDKEEVTAPKSKQAIYKNITR